MTANGSDTPDNGCDIGNTKRRARTTFVSVGKHGSNEQDRFHTNNCPSLGRQALAIASTVSGRLDAVPQTRWTRKGRLVAVAHLSVDASAGRHFLVEICARGALVRQMERFAAGDLLQVVGKISHLYWTNKHGQPGERWTMVAETIECIPYRDTGDIEFKSKSLPAYLSRGQPAYVQGVLDLQCGTHP